MKTKQEIKEWLLENCVDELGNINLSELDFSDFDGDVDICSMKVKMNLWQSCQKVGGTLYQRWQKVGKDLEQSGQNVGGNLWQMGLIVKGYAYIGSNSFAGIQEWDRETQDWKMIKEKKWKIKN